MESLLAIGGMYYAGLGVREDKLVSMKWFRLAAAKGLPETVFIVDCSYAYG